MILTAHYGNSCKPKFLNVIDEKRRSKLENLTIDEIFQSHYLFFDLMQLYVKNLIYFKMYLRISQVNFIHYAAY